MESFINSWVGFRSCINILVELVSEERDDGMALDGMALDGMALDGMALDGMAFDGMALDGMALVGWL